MFSLFKKRDPESTTLRRTVKGIIGKSPKNIHLYRLALSHSSVSEESNERLEYLGDAILGAIVADYLFKKYPYKDEGFLTEIRSRIVKRESLNGLAMKLGLDQIVQFHRNSISPRSIYGNALEAFIGAIYLDLGYRTTYAFILNQIISMHIDLKDVVENNRNFKSMLIEWSQKNNQPVRFDIMKEEGENHRKEFTATVFLNDETKATGTGSSKKKAEQAAAEKLCKELELK